MGKVYFHVDVKLGVFVVVGAQGSARRRKDRPAHHPGRCRRGRRKSATGVVLAKSLPAKKYGIRTGESLFAARAKCPGRDRGAPGL